MKIRKPEVPIAVQGKLNRLESEVEYRTDMTARDNISKGGYFIMHDVAYQAQTAIVKGAEVIPGKNCVAINLNEIIGGK